MHGCCIFIEHFTIFKTYTYLNTKVVRPFSYSFTFRIGTLVVVEKRAVIEKQTHVRRVVVKDVIEKDLVFRKVYWQKQCIPDYRQRLILFESASCKNSETSCLESRRKF